MRTLLAFALACSACPGLASAAPRPALSQDELPRRWSVLVVRDGRTGFTARTAVDAVRVLGRSSVTSADRAAALVAIGAAGAIAERPRLKSWAVEGESLERRGAILGLGELGRSAPGQIGAGTALLEEVLNDRELEIAECALLALLRSAAPGWRERAADMAQDPAHRLGAAALALLSFIEDPEDSRPAPSSVLLLDLRWSGALSFGTVDGQAWSVSLIDTLKADDRFLDEVVLTASAELGYPGIRDHLLETLLENGGPEPVRAAVRAMPLEVERLVDAKVWRPASAGEWTALIETAIREDVTGVMPQTFALAAKEPSVVIQASGILADEDRSFAAYILRAAETGNVDTRVRAARAMGETRISDYDESLDRLVQAKEPRLQAAAWIAALRRRDRGARDRADALLAGPDEAARTAFIDELVYSYDFSNVLPLLEHFAGLVEGIDAARLSACLHLRGRPVDKALLREAFLRMEPNDPGILPVIRAIGSFPTPEDVRFLAGHFPIEGAGQANVELALALIEAGDASVLPILHEAVWRGPWNRSLLAAAVVRDTAGMRLLFHWAESPPASASSADIRRVGFAIGEWGGLEGLEDLTRNLGAGPHRPALQGALLGALSARTH